MNKIIFKTFCIAVFIAIVPWALFFESLGLKIIALVPQLIALGMLIMNLIWLCFGDRQ